MIKEYRPKHLWANYYRKCEDWLEFVSLAERVVRESKDGTFNGYRCASLETGNAKWAGTATLEDAIELAHSGWKPGYDEMMAIREKIDFSALGPMSQQLTEHIDVAGDEPNIDLFLQGNPEHMTTLHQTITAQRGKIFSFYVHRGTPGFTDYKRIIRRGVSLLLVFDVLRLLGYSFEVTIVFANQNYDGSDTYEFYVPIIHAGDPINTDTLAFMLCHPAVLRRLAFAARENEPNDIRKEFEFFTGGGYGESISAFGFPAGGVYIGHTQGLHKHDSEIVPYAKEVLHNISERRGVTLLTE
jgi:hypothetical protein